VGRVAKGDARERQRHQDLRGDDPASAAPEPAAEQRRVVPVEERRPEELELVGDGELAHQPDRGERHLRLDEPRRLGRVDEQERDTLREAETQHRGDAPVGEERSEEGACRGLHRLGRAGDLRRVCHPRVSWDL
jgi:hypothetical protein